MDEKVTLPGWITGKCIGQGSFGKVYEIHRERYGVQEKAALKVLNIPQSPGQIDAMRASGMDEDSITAHFDTQAADIIREYRMMMQLNNSPYIVHCEDMLVEQHNPGFTILLRMELLVPLIQALEQKQAGSERSVVQLGCDLCAALDACWQQHRILHRDIKPQNIFLAPDGTFKLGDFGIARPAEDSGHATVGVGTPSFMAPEVLYDPNYDSRADICSLGLVLYWLLNHYRGPFLPLPPAAVTAQDREQAQTLRFSGTPLPEPARGSPELKAIVLKACSFDPDQRYATAKAMGQDLAALLEGNPEELSVKPVSSKKRKPWLFPLCAGLALAAGAALWALLPQKAPAEVPEEVPTVAVTLPAAPNTSGLTPSMTPGVYHEQISVEISSDDPYANIYYFLADSEDAPVNRELFEYYNQPILLHHGTNVLYAYSDYPDPEGDLLKAVYSLEYPREEITFQEPAIEALVRYTLAKFAGPITNYDCERITDLLWGGLQGLEESPEMGVATLEDLKYFPNLTSLSFTACRRIGDFSGLSYCPKLETLSFADVTVPDLDFILQLPELYLLSLYSCGTEDYSALLEHPGITYLYLENAYIPMEQGHLLTASQLPSESAMLDDILRQMPQLESLGVNLEQLKDPTVLLSLPNLKMLKLRYLEHFDTSILGQMVNLTDLGLWPSYGGDLDTAAAADLSFLPNLKNLTSLDLNCLKDETQLQYITQLPNLKQLTIFHCQVPTAEQIIHEALPHCQVKIY